MPWNLLILPLLGGFLFLRTSNYHTIKFQRFENYRLIFEAAVYGFGLAAMARVFVWALHWCEIFPMLESFLRELAPFSFIGTAVTAFLLGPVVAFLLNLTLDEVSAKDLAIEQAGDNLLALTVDAMDQNDAIMLTLDTRKVYIGYVWESPNLKTAMSNVMLLPAMSGYRDATDMTLKLTTDYISIWRGNKLAARDFVLVIPTASIKSACIFDLALYQKHFGGQGWSRTGRTARAGF